MKPIAFFIFIVFPVFFVSNAFAHKVIIFAWVEDGIVHTESSFGGKRNVHQGNISVFDSNDRLIHQGITDEDGIYSFKIPENISSDIILKLDASTGHKAQWKIFKKELMERKSKNELQTTMEKKAQLNKDPSFIKIILGIAILFSLAFIAKFLKKRSGIKK